MSKTVPLRKEKPQTVRHELTADEIVQQVQKILEIKEKAMKENVHYGIIPGCKKPSLWKPGAEKLCLAFRLEPQFETIPTDDPNRTIKWEKWDYKAKKEIEGMTVGYVEYDSRCTLRHIPTGDIWARNIGGSCNNYEAKYRSLNPYDVKNTIEKMSEKRSLVAAVLIGTAASDIFTQDIEDVPQLISKENAEEDEAQEESGKENAYTNNLKTATDKQVDYIKKLIKKKNISEKHFLEEWEDYFDSWEDIPFNTVNDILDWIREQ